MYQFRAAAALRVGWRETGWMHVGYIFLIRMILKCLCVSMCIAIVVHGFDNSFTESGV